MNRSRLRNSGRLIEAALRLAKQIDPVRSIYMFSRRIGMYSLGMFLLGFLLICSVQPGRAQQQDAIANDATANPIATTASYANGVKTRIRGTVVTISQCELTMRDECGVESVVLLNQRANGKNTEVKLQGSRHRQDVSVICPGACIKVEGRGNCAGQLVAEEIHSRGCEACAPACPPPCPPPCPSACAPPPPPACPAPCNPCASSH